MIFPANRSNNFSVSISLQNASRTDDAYPLLAGREVELRVWLSLLMVLSAVGTITNLALALVTISGIQNIPKLQQSRTRWLITNFAVASIVQSFFMIPVLSVVFYRFSQGVPMPANFCNAVLIPGNIVIAASSWSEVCIAFNRFIALRFPRYYPFWKSGRVTVILILLSWIVACFVVTPIAFGFGGRYHPTSTGMCVNLTFTLAGSWLRLMVSVIPSVTVGFIAMLVILFPVGVTMINLARQKEFPKGEDFRAVEQRATPAFQRNNNTQRHRLAAAKIMLLSFVFCCSCNVPLMVIPPSFPGLAVTMPTLGIWLRIPSSLQFALNPVIIRSLSC